jgi:hypothetical protein
MARKKKDETNNENLENKNDSDDTFGLPDIEYKPLDRQEEPVQASEEAQPVEETPPSQAPQYEYEQKPAEQTPEYAYEPEDEGSSAWPRILGIILVIALALGAVWYFIIKPRQEAAAKAEKAKIEQEARDKEAAEREAALQREREEAERRKADSLANASKVGTVEVLTERTRRYYVVIASAVDDDLLMDYANKLAKSGVSTKIIPPFAKYKLFRLTLSDADSFAAAQATADEKKAEYGDALWVLKY